MKHQLHQMQINCTTTLPSPHRQFFTSQILILMPQSQSTIPATPKLFSSNVFITVQYFAVLMAHNNHSQPISYYKVVAVVMCHLPTTRLLLTYLLTWTSSI